MDKPLPESLLVFGEVGLGGELRGAPHTRQRLKEAQRLGFTHAIIPKSALKELDKAEKYGLRIIGAATLEHDRMGLSHVFAVDFPHNCVVVLVKPQRLNIRPPPCSAKNPLANP